MLTITLIPNLAVFISQFSKSGLNIDFLSSNMWTLGNLILQAIFYSISYSIIGITFSAAINRESLASAGFFGTVYGVSLVVEIFYVMTHNSSSCIDSTLSSFFNCFFIRWYALSYCSIIVVDF